MRLPLSGVKKEKGRKGEKENNNLIFNGKEDPHCLVNDYDDQGYLDVYFSSRSDIQSHSSSANVSPLISSYPLKPSQSSMSSASPRF
jgi:hypothetical protein